MTISPRARRILDYTVMNKFIIDENTLPHRLIFSSQHTGRRRLGRNHPSPHLFRKIASEKERNQVLLFLH